jgi:prepilin-type N-terminal cleavage/methylation domain-containing protein
MSTTVRDRLRRASDDDDGFSLIEVLISMSIMSVVMVVAIAAIAQIYSNVNRTDQTAFARDVLGNGFRRMDTELRYARWLSKPDWVGTRFYFEYEVPNNGCRQLKYEDGAVYLSSWTSVPVSTPGPAQKIQSDLGLVNGVVPPFQVIAVHAKPFATAAAGTAGVGKDFSPEHAQVRVVLNATVGKVTLLYDNTWTAQNTSDVSPKSSECSKGRPTS